MNLVIDQGNTAIKCGLFEGNKLVGSNRFSYNEQGEIIKWINTITDESPAIIISSVVDQLVDFDVLKPKSLLVLGPKTPLPLVNAYRQPETLGKDRLANAAASLSLNKQGNSLSVDLGTCIKYDLVTKEGHYLGGAISPGLTMRFKALNAFTAKLPLIENSTPLVELGTDTASSISAGVKQGILHEINGFIERYSIHYSDLTIFMTGGDLKYFDKGFKKPIFAHADLTLIGLNEILQYNILQK